MPESITSESVVTLTPRAVEEIKAMTRKPDNTGKSLRVYVEKGGCSGMQYSLIYDEQRDGDLTSEAGGVRVLVDAFSAQYLRGSQVDFSDDLTSGGFKIINPNAQESCGCGKSFNT
jgi:iron-sulfur cluster assembly accessory protein